MSRSIWKYDVPISDALASFTMPVLARIVHVAVQKPGHVTFWAEVDRRASPTALRGFRIYGTGHDIDNPDHEYVGTALDSPFVWHLYETRA